MVVTLLSIGCNGPTIVDPMAVHTIAQNKQSVIDFLNKAHHAINPDEKIEKLDRSEITVVSKKSTRSQELWFVVSNLGNKYTFKLQISKYSSTDGPMYRYEILESRTGWSQ
jgi:hypothetical protein